MLRQVNQSTPILADLGKEVQKRSQGSLTFHWRKLHLNLLKIMSQNDILRPKRCKKPPIRKYN